MKFRTRQVEVEAVHYDGTPAGYDRVCAFAPGVQFEPLGSDEFSVQNGNGCYRASPGDWIIRSADGQLRPCSPDVFADAFEAVRRAPDVPKLFVVYLGGKVSDGRMGEDHEVVVVVAVDATSGRKAAKAKWRGIGDPHVDAVQEVTVVDHHKVYLVQVAGAPMVLQVGCSLRRGPEPRDDVPNGHISRRPSSDSDNL